MPGTADNMKKTGVFLSSPEGIFIDFKERKGRREGDRRHPHTHQLVASHTSPGQRSNLKPGYMP